MLVKTESPAKKAENRVWLKYVHLILYRPQMRIVFSELLRVTLNYCSLSLNLSFLPQPQIPTIVYVLAG